MRIIISLFSLSLLTFFQDQIHNRLVDENKGEKESIGKVKGFINDDKNKINSSILTPYENENRFLVKRVNR